LAPVASELAANIAARRARQEAAFQAVHALRRQSVTKISDAIVGWLNLAYGWRPMLGVSVEEPYRLLERHGQIMLFHTIGGDAYPTWRDIDMLLATATNHNADVMAIAAPGGVPSSDELSDSYDYGLRLWGPSELEMMYLEIEFEGTGIGF
jgi:hypothetical protein